MFSQYGQAVMQEFDFQPLLNQQKTVLSGSGRPSEKLQRRKKKTQFFSATSLVADGEKKGKYAIVL